jgi:nitrite reductase/ring-hydroxylating ferredoxin subunit
VTIGERIERLIPTGDGKLDDVAGRLQEAVAVRVEQPWDGKLQDALHGVWLGHPLHPSLTDVPIGAWSAALALDGAGALGVRGLERATRLVVLVGLAGAVGAAASGATDWSKSGDTGSRVGLVHAGLNAAATMLFAASLGAGGQGTARLLRLAGAGLVGAGAWLGGKLVYGESLGVDRNAGRVGPEDWMDVAALADLPDGALAGASADGFPVALLRRGDEVLAIGGVCSHLGGPLSEGELEGDVVTCPWHGSRFCMRDGAVEHGPATFPQPCLETRVRGGRVEVREPLPGEGFS